MGTKKRKGSPPKPSEESVAEPVPTISARGFPILSLRHLQDGFGVEEMTEKQRSSFLVKWAKRSKLTWQELLLHPKHGLGHENLPRTKFKPAVPESLSQERYMVFRHDGNLPFAGIRVGDTFFALWVECKYGDLYDH